MEKKDFIALIREAHAALARMVTNEWPFSGPEEMEKAMRLEILPSATSKGGGQGHGRRPGRRPGLPRAGALRGGVLLQGGPGALLGLVGLVWGMPEIRMPAFTGFDSVKGPLWPVLFITISCGAASGWHSLIAAGTTSKQLARERHGFSIAYGGMVGETVMALLSAMLVCAAFDRGQFLELLASGSSAIGLAFSGALGSAVANLGIPAAVGTTIGALALAALTLTTLDSFARTGRYVVQELARPTLLSRPLPASLFVTGGGYAPHKALPFMELWHGLVLGGLPLAFIVPTTLAGLVYLFYTYWFTGSFSLVSGLLVLFLGVLLATLLSSTVRRLRRLPMRADIQRGQSTPSGG